MGIRSVVSGLLLFLIAGVLAAGCGGGSGAGGGQGGTTQATTQQGASAAQKGAATIAVTNNSELGKILVDGSGRTLYLFTADKEGKSNCSSGCAQVWPPLTSRGEPTAAQGASADKLGTISRDNGTTQVTYNGHPLYYYAPDEGPGDVKGQGLEQFGGEWYVVSPGGNKVEKGEEEKEGGDSGGSEGGGY